MSEKPQQPTAYPLRMPDELRQALAESAHSSGRSLNAEIVNILSRAMTDELIPLSSKNLMLATVAADTSGSSVLEVVNDRVSATFEIDEFFSQMGLSDENGQMYLNAVHALREQQSELGALQEQVRDLKEALLIEKRQQKIGLDGPSIEAKLDMLTETSSAIVKAIEQAAPPHEVAMTALLKMYQEALGRIEELKSRKNLSPMEQVELQHEEHTAKYLRHAAARAAMPPEERPPQKKQSMPIGIDSNTHLATLVALSTPHPERKPKK